MKIIHNVLLIVSRIAGCNKNKLSRGHKFTEDLNFCPTDLAEMFSKVEDEFKIELTKEDELQIKSIEDLIKSIKGKLNNYNEYFDTSNFYAEYIYWLQRFM
jgi:acyl carrier protein